jgi:membrane-bound metal-dependent hydrolase YbcI (DUF457 family)
VASLPSHTVAALCIGTCFYKSDIPKRIWVIGVACSVVPDLDVIGFRLGIHYGDFWGHRGFTHSLLFAALLALFIVVLWVSAWCDRHVPVVDVVVFLFCHCKSRLTRCDDEWWSRRSILCALRHSPLLSSLDSDSSIANWSRSLL